MNKNVQMIFSMNNRSDQEIKVRNQKLNRSLLTRTVSREVCGALLTVTAGLLAWQPAADACTRVLWNNNKVAVVVGRSMDWPESTDPVLTVLPRGMERDGGRAGSEVIVKDNPARWTSRYASLVTTVYGIGTADGLNERGLGAHMLYLKTADFGPRVPRKPALQAGLWAQFLLDNAATVEEALALLDTVQVVMLEAHGYQANVHLAIEDASGDSAIIEYVNGRQTVHHGREYRIMTNDPLYDEQLALLKKHDFSKPSSATPLPGNVSPEDRFQRASYFAALLPEPKSEREAVAYVLAIVRNASVPFGAPYADFGIYNTEYRTVTDLANKRYFFELTTSPNVFWANLPKFDLAPGASVMILEPDNIELSGDVTGRFQKAPAPF